MARQIGWYGSSVTSFGGTAALVNLAVFAIGLALLPASISPFMRTLIADVIACEVSLIANFIPNDYFTFRHVSGRQRPWIARCARFHLTSLVGSLLTILLQQFFSHVVHLYPLFGQALARFWYCFITLPFITFLLISVLSLVLQFLAKKIA